ncbi:MAG: hypothetical protein K9I82_15295 [Chitinophagaceae bacterium]|nr:hypothetical protein [Chitinophagaceae bacterium]
MFMYGTQLTQPQDVMRKVNAEALFKEITQSQGKLYDQIKQLRSIKLMDEKQFKKLKVILPYFVCGVFSPAQRKKENFAYTEHFVVDIDHISRNDQSIDGIKNKLIKDDRILMVFVSPGNDGLKLIFHLTERITDSNYFTYFYKKFCISLADQYQLHGLIDTKTSDVSRCCFLSYDVGAYFNENPNGISPEEILSPFEMGEMNRIKHEEKAYDKKVDELVKEGVLQKEPEKGPSSLTDDILTQIKLRINPTARIKQAVKEYYIPPELNEAWVAIESKLNEAEMYIESNRKINYGRQVKIKAGRYWCELNIFFGKKGFTVLKTTKTGSNETLATLSQQYLQDYLSGN